jgi:F-type H+-transporting ATPase subunit b
LEINITLVAQMLVFAAFVWFTMRFVWPPLMTALEERKDRIAEGLAAAERGRRELELAQHHAKAELKQAKIDAADILEKATRRAAQLLEEARLDTRLEIERMQRNAAEQLAQEVNQARVALRKETATLAIACAEKILKAQVDASLSGQLVDQLISEI